MEFNIGIWRLFDALVKIVRLSAVNSSLERYSEHLRHCMCEFQLRYTNYHFAASRIHRDFKHSLEDESVDSEVYFIKLNQFIDKGLKTLCGDIAQGMQDYFVRTHLHKEKPRIGIHLVNDEDEVIDVIMFPTGSKRTSKKLNGYSAFLEICASGVPYLANNLPLRVKKSDDYRHNGIDVEEVRKVYKPLFRDRKLIARLQNNYLRKILDDREWGRMTLNGGRWDTRLYKSHLVLPITFRKHAAKEMLDSKLVEVLKLPDSGRAILGFICIDHPSTYYFDNGPVSSFENIDINAMYVFADMLSLVIVTWLMYTTGSTSYEKYEEGVMRTQS